VDAYSAVMFTLNSYIPFATAAYPAALLSKGYPMIPAYPRTYSRSGDTFTFRDLAYSTVSILLNDRFGMTQNGAGASPK